MNIKTIIIFLAISFPLSSNAAILNFNELTSGHQNSNSISLSNATILSTGADIFVASPNTYIPSVGPNGGFCGVISIGGGNCSTDVTITFNSTISNLRFQSTAFGIGDTALASIFNGTNLLHSISVNSNAVIDFSSYSNITSLFIDDLGSISAGFVYGDFNFDQTTQVSAPATVAFLGLGLTIIGMRRRK